MLKCYLEQTPKLRLGLPDLMCIIERLCCEQVEWSSKDISFHQAGGVELKALCHWIIGGAGLDFFH